METPGLPLIRILIVDDHALVCTALHLLIENRPGLHVVGAAANRPEALSLAARAQPDIILLALNPGDRSGLDLLPALLAVARSAQVLILTGSPDPDQHRHAVCLGAKGIVPKEKSPETLLTAIEKVHAGEVWLEPAMLATVLHELTPGRSRKPLSPEEAKITALTARERAVITCIGAGLRNKQIAQRLLISETTVRHHLTAIFDKLGLAWRLELMIYAYRHGLAPLPAAPRGEFPLR